MPINTSSGSLLVHLGITCALAIVGCARTSANTGWVAAKTEPVERGQVVSYQQFQRSYRPHDKRPTSDRKAIRYMIALHQRGMLTPRFMKHFIADLLAEGERGIGKWQVVIVGVPRPLAGQMMDKTDVAHRATLLNSLPASYALDILYYVAEATYEATARDVSALREH